MGLFDMFKNERPKLQPRVALAVGVLYMMAADGQIGEEELGQLRGIVGADRALLDTAVKYWRAASFDEFLQAAPGVLDDRQRLCLLVNACDSLLADGVAAPQERRGNTHAHGPEPDDSDLHGVSSSRLRRKT